MVEVAVVSMMGLAIVLLSLMVYVLHDRFKQRTRDFIEARGAAQSMCRLVGDAERLLGQNAALWGLMTPEIADAYSVLVVGKEEHSVLSSPLRHWQARAEKISHWREEAAKQTERYSAVIGQDPNESWYRKAAGERK